MHKDNSAMLDNSSTMHDDRHKDNSAMLDNSSAMHDDSSAMLNDSTQPHEYSTPAKETGHTEVNINEYEKEQVHPKGNTAPPNSPAHLVMEILDEVLSTPCSAAAKESTEDEDAVENHGEVETIEDIQAFMNKPVSIAIKESKFTPGKDDKEVDHSKVVRKLNMDAKNIKPAIGNHPIQASMQQKKRQDEKASVKRMSRSVRSGLVFPVSRVAGQMRKGKYARHIRVTAAIYLTAVLEYLVAEVLELSGNCARYYNKRRIFPRCILLTLRHDAELDQLTKGAIVPQGGVKPFIHRELLPVERQVSLFHPRFGGFLSTQDMLKYNLKPSIPEEDSPLSSQASQ